MTSQEVLKGALSQIEGLLSSLMAENARLTQENTDLRSRLDVSQVKMLTNENAEIKSELQMLKKKLKKIQDDETESKLSTLSKNKPKVVQKQPEPVPAPAPVAVAPVVAPAPSVPQTPASKMSVTKKSKDVASVPVPEPAPVPVPAAQEQDTYDENQFPESELDDADAQYELLYIALESGKYFWDPETGELFAVLDGDTEDQQPGDAVGKIKCVKVKGEMYYHASVDDVLYECTADGDIGARKGKLVSGRATFDKKK